MFRKIEKFRIQKFEKIQKYTKIQTDVWEEW